MNTEALKLSIINRILGLQDPSLIEEVDKAVRNILPKESVADFSHLIKPMRKELNVDELKKEQQFAPIDKEQFFAALDALAIEEPLDELLEMS